METTNIKTLNWNKLKNKSTIISSEEALKDVEPIKWSEDVLTGKKKINVRKNKFLNQIYCYDKYK